MFTGIVECLGVLRRRRADALDIGAPAALVSQLEDGDSVCVQGVCLTVRERVNDGFVADLSAETASRTTVARLPAGTSLNLERALPVGGRLGGHIVLGHIDAVGRVKELRPDGGGWTLGIGYPPAHAARVVSKGCICVDGISLTPYDVTASSFRCAIVHATRERTHLKGVTVGDEVNLEYDIVGKYVQRMIDHVPRG